MKRGKTEETTAVPWRAGDAGFTVFGPPNGNPSPETVACVKRPANARRIVQAVNNYDNLLAVCSGLVDAYRMGEESGSVSWEQLDEVHRLAQIALKQVQEGK